MMAGTTVPEPKHEESVFRVRAPSTFSTQIEPHEIDAFWEHQTITFMGECLYPDGFIGWEA